MSVDPGMRKYLKMVGSRICKLYLGNILNIDIETPVFYPGMSFAHHVIGEFDNIWVSPHYAQHSEYAASLNHVDPRKEPKVAPYIWDPSIITDNGKRKFQWRPHGSNNIEQIVIMEPNIRFQKSSLLPIMGMERWFRKNPGWNGEINVCNGNRLMVCPLFRDSILPSLDLFKANKIKFHDRKDILTVLNEFPSATFILHQWNNEYNYMFLELLWYGFPVIHNSQAWFAHGYYYNNCNIEEMGNLYNNIREKHNEVLETYKAHSQVLTWKHSPYNPEIQRQWHDLISN